MLVSQLPRRVMVKVGTSSELTSMLVSLTTGVPSPYDMLTQLLSKFHVRPSMSPSV